MFRNYPAPQRRISNNPTGKGPHAPPPTPGGVPGARDNHVRLWDIETATPPPSVLPPSSLFLPCHMPPWGGEGRGRIPLAGFPRGSPHHAREGGELFSFRHPCMQVGGFGSGSSRPGVEGVGGDPPALAQPPVRSPKGFVYGVRGVGCRWAAASRPTAPPGTSSKTPSGSVRLNP